MIGGAKYYIISQYFKYIFLNILIFIGLIWVSQILRILELQNSISNQLLDVVKTTILVLPSFVGTLSSFLFLLASIYLNIKLNSSNEIIIIKQYFGFKDISVLIFFIMVGLFLVNLLNNEYFSVKLYEKYKINELEIRNNLKLGIPNQNEFIIENELSIFFDSKKDGTFYDVEALIYQDSQFIKSKSAEIEISKKNFNLIFKSGERLTLNNEEVSNTKFKKFIYSIENKNIEELLYDKEHFNTLDLISHSDLEFRNHGHNRLFLYFLTFLILLISLKIIFLYKERKIMVNLFAYIFILLLIIQIINSYLVFLLNSNSINVIGYYLFNITNLSILIFLILKAINK
jgi:lipopolysaccharide export LptBFGC system permease protein LptF